MAVIRQGELFNWKDVEVAGVLDKLRLVIEAVSHSPWYEYQPRIM